MELRVRVRVRVRVRARARVRVTALELESRGKGSYFHTRMHARLGCQVCVSMRGGGTCVESESRKAK